MCIIAGSYVYNFRCPMCIILIKVRNTGNTGKKCTKVSRKQFGAKGDGLRVRKRPFMCGIS